MIASVYNYKTDPGMAPGATVTVLMLGLIHAAYIARSFVIVGVFQHSSVVHVLESSLYLCCQMV